MQTSSGPRMGGTEWGILLALSVLWGGSFYFFKILGAELPPLTIVLGRVATASLLLHLFLWATGGKMPFSLRELRVPLLVMGLTNNIIPFTLIVFGETRISSGMASVLNATVPIFTVIAVQFMTKDERLNGARIAGIALGFAGVGVLVAPDLIAQGGIQDVVGQLACLVAAISYAFGGPYGRRFKNYPPVTIAAGMLGASALMLLPLAVLFDRPWDLPVPSNGAWAAWAALAVFSTSVAYILVFRLLATAGATNLSLVTFLVPVSALLLGWLALGETIGTATLGGMVLIGLGLAAIDGRLPAWLRRRILGAPETC